MEIVGSEMPKSLRCDTLPEPAQATEPDGVSDLKIPATWDWSILVKGLSAEGPLTSPQGQCWE